MNNNLRGDTIPGAPAGSSEGQVPAKPPGNPAKPPVNPAKPPGPATPEPPTLSRTQRWSS